MNRIIAGGIVFLQVVSVACSSQSPITAPPTAAPSPTPLRKSGTIRFSLQDTPDVIDVPWLMALDTLNSQGYTPQIVSISNGELIPAAQMRGDIEIGAASSNIAWSAIAKGADIRTIVGRGGTTFDLVAKQDIQDCRDLNNRAVAFSTRQAVGYVMFEKYTKQNCPDMSPQIVLIGSSANRLAALLAGEVDGAYLSIQDWLQVKSQAPGKFRVLLDFAREFPQVQLTTFSVRREWALKNPEMVKDFIRALLAANRRVIANPAILRDEIARRLSLDAAKAQERADTYLASGIWDANGQLTSENLAATIDFLSSNGSVPSGMKVEDVADLSYLNTVLDEIGRK